LKIKGKKNKGIWDWRDRHLIYTGVSTEQLGLSGKALLMKRLENRVALFAWISGRLTLRSRTGRGLINIIEEYAPLKRNATLRTYGK
jgi:hypothetical protein